MKITKQTIDSAFVSGTVRALRGLYLQRALEEASCRCTPLRPALEEVESRVEQRGQELIATMAASIGIASEKLTSLFYGNGPKELVKELEPALVAKQVRLEDKVRELDRIDHPKAHAMYEPAERYARVWVLEQVAAGVELPTDREELCKRYAGAIAAGWKPTGAA